MGHLPPGLLARQHGIVARRQFGGEAAKLGGRASGFLLALLRGTEPAPEIWTPERRTIPGVLTRRGGLGPLETATFRGVPSMTVPRVLIALAADMALDDLARACNEAQVKHGTTPQMVDRLLTTHTNAKQLRAVLNGDDPTLLSELERRFLDLLCAAALPLPRTNRPTGSHVVDCRWPEHALTVELDSFRFHNSRLTWERDRQREREAHTRGDRFRRYTWLDVVDEPDELLRDLVPLLA